MLEFAKWKISFASLIFFLKVDYAITFQSQLFFK